MARRCVLAKLMNWFELKHLAERNQLTEADALEMGEQAKADLKYVKYDEKFLPL
ncbi:MAG: hypothetical protein EPGJADBJ_02004 [Saprospiraceae bacterium]|nr:hypothetical protein [Saprospiraceae bacterium]